MYSTYPTLGIPRVVAAMSSTQLRMVANVTQRDLANLVAGWRLKSKDCPIEQRGLPLHSCAGILCAKQRGECLSNPAPDGTVSVGASLEHLTRFKPPDIAPVMCRTSVGPASNGPVTLILTVLYPVGATFNQEYTVSLCFRKAHCC